jgi:hypothetical protein
MAYMAYMSDMESMEQLPERQSDSPSVNLEHLEPHEVLDLYSYVVRHESDSPSFAQQADAVSSAIHDLPASDLEKARQVYTAFATSRNASEREDTSYFLLDLVRQDPGHGLQLWKQLISDPVPAVRDAAYFKLGDYLGGDTPEQTESALAQLGISWFDIVNLLDAYVHAIKGTRTEVGHLALSKALERPT